MPGFLYYLPGEKQNELIERDKFNRDALARWKLEETLSDCSIHPDHILVREVKGPDDAMGLLLVPRPLDGSVPVKSYQPEHQEWRRAEDKSGKWIGWFKDEPPGPQDLIKRTALGCKYIIRDAKENEWAIITARSEGGIALPCSYTFVDGELTTRVKPGYRPLFELSGEVFDHMAVLFTADDENAEHLKDEFFLVNAAIQVLITNYRIGMAEIAALDEMDYELLVSENVTAILLCFVDQPVLDEFQKWNEALKQKKSSSQVQSSQNSSSGQEDLTIPIDPVDAAL